MTSYFPDNVSSPEKLIACSDLLKLIEFRSTASYFTESNDDTLSEKQLVIDLKHQLVGVGQTQRFASLDETIQNISSQGKVGLSGLNQWLVDHSASGSNPTQADLSVRSLFTENQWFSLSTPASSIVPKLTMSITVKES